jgi:hypothetical protein
MTANTRGIPYRINHLAPGSAADAMTIAVMTTSTTSESVYSIHNNNAVANTFTIVSYEIEIDAGFCISQSYPKNDCAKDLKYVDYSNEASIAAISVVV